MPVNGKQKGARAELEIAKLFQAWWLPFEPVVEGQPLTFKRTPGSGGWAHGKGRASFGTSADLITNSKAFPFAVEVKHRQGWSWENFLKGGRSPVWGWWSQCVGQALEVNKSPLLAFRKNREPWRFMLEPADLPPVVSIVPLYSTHDEAGILVCVYLAETILSLPPSSFVALVN